VPHTAGGAEDQHGLAGLQRRAIDQRMVRGTVGEGERCAVLERNAWRQREQPGRVDAGMGAEASGTDERRNGVAHLELRDACSNGFDDARELRSGHERQSRLELVLVLHDQQIREIQARRADGHAHLAGSGLGRREFLPRQRFDACWLFAEPCVHRLLLVCSRLRGSRRCRLRRRLRAALRRAQARMIRTPRRRLPTIGHSCAS
jgi:hypothetical protein